MLGNFLPRQCGIATYTADLANTLAELDQYLTIDSIAMSDHVGYEYPDQVVCEIPDHDESLYLAAADFINGGEYDVLSVQHEYGIFGGESGSHLMKLVREARMPIVTTLHTVLRDPSPSQKVVMDELLQLSERVVVMSKIAVEFLEEVHGLSRDKVDLIPHGIPHIPAQPSRDVKKSLGISGQMILTFGLLSPDKGVQYVIEALPKILEKHPDAVYVVVGATHPQVRNSTGEAYRESLISFAKDLGVAKSVRFVDRFVAAEELVDFLSAMDIYITPYLNPKQITSGTLAYAIGAGKPVISTPYWYAEELLADKRGMLVPFKDADAIATAVMQIQDSNEMRLEMGRKAAAFGRQMLWPEVGKNYLSTFDRARRDSADRLRILVQTSGPIHPLSTALPRLKLDHLFELTDDTGILQHATFTIANRVEGYCVDDNARALLLTAYLADLDPFSPELTLNQTRYLSFVLDAYNPVNRRFRNFMSYGRQWLEEAGSEDSQGRSLWALGAMVNRCKVRGRKAVARALFDQASPALVSTTSPRTWAYGVLASIEYLDAFPDEYAVQVLLQTLAGRLFKQYDANRSEEWPWLEQSLSYANARVPQAMMLAGQKLASPQLIKAAEESLTWLMKLQTGTEGVFAPIGTNGFQVRGGPRNFFDQQPIEAWASVSACLTAFVVLKDESWMEEAHRAFNWFLGKNMLGVSCYEPETGGCHDGLHGRRLNENQGAESTLSFLCALTELRLATTGRLIGPLKSGIHEI